MTPNQIVSTVGTSLLFNLAESGSSIPHLFQAYQRKAWCEVATHLAALAPSDRLCGAEINSLFALLNPGRIETSPIRLHFCVSDTEAGHAVGEVLQAYYEKTAPVSIYVIEGLQDEAPETFRTVGLRNLVRKVGELARSAGDSRLLAINATGGYKAQMAVAVLIGQALGSPVYYKHERFSTIIPFPPMPISFDYELLAREAALLDHLEQGELVEMAPERMEERLRVLLEEAPGENGGHLWALAPIGQIYLEGFRWRHPIEKALPAVAETRREPTFRDDHYPIGFRDYVRKVWRECAFFTGCHSLPYDRQNAIRDRTFYVRQDGQIIGEYVDRNGFGGRFGIDTTARTEAERTAVVMHLNAVYGRS